MDQCITAYLLEQLTHDEESASNLIALPPQSSLQESMENRRTEYSDIPDIHKPEDQQYLGQTPPINLPSRPIGQMEGFVGYVEGVNSAFSQANTAPYSKSSPGGVFGSHMEQRDRDLGRNGPGGTISRSEEGNFAGSMKREPPQQTRANVAKRLFKPLEDYIIASFGSFECVNSSFSTARPHMAPRAASEGTKLPMVPAPASERYTRNETQMSELDAKTLLLGDFAENGSWWTGERSDIRSPERTRTQRAGNNHELVTLKSPRIDWFEMNEWYNLVVDGGRSWQERLDDLTDSELQRPSDQLLEEMEEQFLEAQSHAQRVLLKATESLLKRPGRLLSEPNDLRFLLIILANPLLYPVHSTSKTKERSRSRSRSRDRITPFVSNSPEAMRNLSSASGGASNAGKGSSGQHSGIIKRILGLLSNVSNECHHHLVSWFARYSDSQFQRAIDLIGSFVTYRLTRQHGKKREVDQDLTAGLIPSMSGPGRHSSAALHAALGVSGQTSKKNDSTAKPVLHNDDWQIKAAARVMALLFSANNSGLTRRGELRPLALLDGGHGAGLAARDRAHTHGQIVPTSDFYNTLLDYTDLIADFEAWESKRAKFSFCQYPFFLSIWAKIQIMEHDARRQMEVKAREAFFDSIMTRKTVNQYLVLKIRRDCLVEDSLKGVSEVVGTGGEEIKKVYELNSKEKKE